MDNYKIGIKLADGSFYPILEEGNPQVKTIELTTVRDDQTTVQLDLYRSSSDDMEDAEYVDTLLVENLLPRPKETPTLNLKIEIDSDNVLSASIEDSESGESSETKVSLVNLDSSERTIVPDFSMIDANQDDNEQNDILLDEFADNTIAIENNDSMETQDDGEDLNLDDFGDVNDLLSDEDITDDSTEALQEPEDFSLDDDFSNDETPVELASEDPLNQSVIEDNSEIEISSTENNVDFSEPILDEMPEVQDEQVLDEMPSLDLPEIEDEPVFEQNDDLDLSSDLDEMPEVQDEQVLDEMPSLDLPEIEDEPVFEQNDDLDLSSDLDEMPEVQDEQVLDEMPSLDLPEIEDEPTFEQNDDLDSSSDFGSDDFSYGNEDIMQDSILDSSDFADSSNESLDLMEEEFPDFSDIPTNSENDVASLDDDEDNGFFGIGNDYGDLNTDMDFDEDAFSSNIDTSSDLDDSIPSPDLSFSDLYVNPTEDDCPEKRRCSIPVLICSLCAVVCVLILLLIIFLTPSKIKDKESSNLSSIWHKEEPTVQEVIPAPIETKVEEAVEELEVVVEEEAKEDEIVIVEAPIVTPVEPEPVKEKLKGVEYKIKWGDTLWDIAGTYYKNPWLYREIAEYNNLENPDYIVSGTIITIPPR